MKMNCSFPALCWLWHKVIQPGPEQLNRKTSQSNNDTQISNSRSHFFTLHFYSAFYVLQMLTVNLECEINVKMSSSLHTGIYHQLASVCVSSVLITWLDVSAANKPCKPFCLFTLQVSVEMIGMPVHGYNVSGHLSDLWSLRNAAWTPLNQPRLGSPSVRQTYKRCHRTRIQPHRELTQPSVVDVRRIQQLQKS